MREPIERALDVILIVVLAASAFVLFGRWALRQVFGL